MQLALLKVFLAASTVRNILQRPQPPGQSANVRRTSASREETLKRSIPAWYLNHVWSVDRTIVHRWGIWPIYLLVAIDHYSRRIVCVAPLEGANAGWTVEVLQRSFEEFGAPKHIITDQEPVFRSAAFAELLGEHGVKHRLGAVGQHGSIAVTERAIKTLKYEWLQRAPILKGYQHLQELCASFSEWYNHWRPHMSVEGCRPNDVFLQRTLEKPQPDAKVVPLNLERRFFPETRTTAYRLQEAT